MSTSITFSQEDLQILKNYLNDAKRVVVLPHTAPDGDAIGSILAWAYFVETTYEGTQVDIVSPDRVEAYLHGIPGIEHLTIYPDREDEALSLIAGADLICHLDHNQVSRLRYTPLVKAVKKSCAKRILIDHHIAPEAGFDLSFSYPECSSTCELVYLLVKALGYSQTLSGDRATALCFGIVTDTGRFMYSCFSPELYQHFAELLALGADYPYIIDQLSYHGTLRELKLKGYMLHEKLEVYPELGAAVLTLSQKEIQQRGITKGDTEGIVNLPLSIEGVDCVAFIREDKTQVKLSLRSLGAFPINELAMRAFGGGGHLNAAGGEHQGTIVTARDLFLDTLREMRLSYPKTAEVALS